jgi:hypothetical protein
LIDLRQFQMRLDLYSTQTNRCAWQAWERVSITPKCSLTVKSLPSPPVGRTKLAGAGTRRRKARGKAAATERAGRRGRVSLEVLQAIASGKGTTRAALITLFGFEENKPGQVSISNALSQLKVKKLIKSGKARGEWLAA